MPIDSTNADRLIKLIESGVVDRQTAIEEAKRYSILAPSVQALEIIRRKKKEAQEELNAMVSQETETAAGVAEATAKFARAKA
jgi:transcription initiation factor IIE alpha subunit